MKIRPGRFLSVAIVLTWVCLLSVHLRRSYSRPARSPATSPLLDLTSNSSPEAELTQRAVFYRGVRIGYLRERFTPLPHDGFRAEQTGELTLNLLGRERRVEMEGSAETGAKGELRRFSFRLSTSSRRSSFETLVLGEVERDELRLTIRSGGSERIEHRIVVEPLVLPLNLYYSLAARGLTPGDTYRLRLFDPMTLSEGDAVIEVKGPEIVRWGGREEEAHRLLTTFAGLTTTAWINDRGEVLQEETPLGWTLRKEAPGSSIQALDGSASPDVVLMSAVRAIGFSDESSDLTSVVVELRNFPEGFAALEGGRQKLHGTRLAIAREAPPYHGDETLSDEERTRALSYDAFIQTNDPAIRDLAGRLAVGETDAEKAEALNRWVYDNLAKSPTLSLPSATEILKQRVGDCNEHTVLFTALSRAAGIPTRIATGLTYTRGQFYYHAWPEVFLGRWLALDPTLGQFPADPLHLRLLVGGIESQYEVLHLLERNAAVEVLEAR